MSRSIQAPWIALMFFVLPACWVTAQEPAPRPDNIPVEGDDDVDEIPADLPVGPETTILGRPDAFPSSPLGESTVLTPTRTEAFSAEIGSSITVITEQQIINSRQTQVTEVLRNVPGLNVVQSGTPGGLTSVFIRGANSAHTKVMIDGIPVNDPSSASSAFDFSNLSVDNIQRIEILRGPQSMLYGAGAIGGVINIITKRGEGPMSFQANLMGGSYGTSREAISLSGGNSSYNYSFGASYLQSDGFSAGDDRFGNTELDGLRQGNFSGRVGWTPSDCFDVDYVFRYTDTDSEIDDLGFGNGVPPTDNPIRQSRKEAFFNRVQVRKLLLEGFWEQKVGFSYIHYDRLDTDPGFFGVPRFLGSSRVLDYQSNFRFSDDHTLSVGVDYLDENASTPTVSESQNNKGLYVQDQIRLADHWSATAGFRWDDHSAAGTAQTYRVTTLYQMPRTGTSFHGSIGTGFRAPALAENLFPFGTPGLLPERSKGWDCGLEQSLYCDQLVIDGTYFRNDFNDLIQFDFSTFTLENIGRAFSSGVELTAAWQVNPCSTIRANYVHTFTEDLSTGLPLRRRPPHTASLTLEQNHDWGTFIANLMYVGRRLDSSDGSVFLGEYFLLNLAGTYDLDHHRQLFVRLDNVLGEAYDEVFGFGEPGFSAYAGMNFRW